MVRLFVAVPIPEKVKNSIADLVAELQKVRGLPKDIRFAPEENWHFTLTFLGSEPEETVQTIETALKEIDFGGAITIEFEKVVFGPVGSRPRMIWLTVTGETSLKLNKIKNLIEEKLLAKGVKWHCENRPFQGHLTLCRFEPSLFNDLPRLDKKLDLRYDATEIRLMKSILKRTGAEYETLSGVVL